MKTIFATFFLLAVICQAAPSDDKRVSCRFTRDTGGGGRTDIVTSTTGYTSLSARSLGEPALNLEFTRALNTLGVIPLNEYVVAVSYTSLKGDKCEKGTDVRDIECKEKLAQIAVVTHRRDKNKVTYERKFTAQFDSVELRSQRTDEGAAWSWQFVKEGKWAYTGVIDLWGCEYGTHHWDN